MGRLVYINGAPGVGKLTIARVMARHLGARLLDNHTIYNVGFALNDFRSAEFYNTVRAVRDVTYNRILQLADHEIVILTAADFADSDWGLENWRAVQRLSVIREWPFFFISLTCDASEHRRRIATEEREARGKLRNANAVAAISQRPLIIRKGDRSIELDVTNLAAEDASTHLIEWMTTYL